MRRETQWAEKCQLATNLALEGQGSAWSRGAGREQWWNQEIPFYCGPSQPLSRVPTCPNLVSPRKRKRNMPWVSPRPAGFVACVGPQEHRCAGVLGLPAGRERDQSSATPRAPEHSAIWSPSSGRRPQAPLRFSLRWCHMSCGGVGTQGVGGGVRARRGPPSPPICTETRLTDARNSQ